MTDHCADERWMRTALSLAAEAAAQGEVPVGAVVVRDGELLGSGRNQSIGASDPSAHAEIVALRAAAGKVNNYRLPGATLYVTIEPCTMCAGALVHARIARLVFAAPEPKAGAVVSAAQTLSQRWLNHQVQVSSGVLAHAAAAQLKTFFAQRRGATQEPQ